MSDNNKPKINVPRFNLTWLYVIIALIFAFLYFSGDEGSATKEVNYTEFQEMVTKGYADKIVAYDNNTVVYQAGSHCRCIQERCQQSRKKSFHQRTDRLHGSFG